MDDVLQALIVAACPAAKGVRNRKIIPGNWPPEVLTFEHPTSGRKGRRVKIGREWIRTTLTAELNRFFDQLPK